MRYLIAPYGLTTFTVNTSSRVQAHKGVRFIISPFVPNRKMSALGQRLPLRLRWQHVRCTPDAQRTLVTAESGQEETWRPLRIKFSSSSY
jgi:hypothetical protein